MQIIAGVADIDDDDDGSVGRIGLSVKLPMPSGLFREMGPKACKQFLHQIVNLIKMYSIEGSYAMVG